MPHLDVVSLLDADPDLGDRLPPEEFAAAVKALPVRVLTFEAGPWHPDKSWDEDDHPALGLLLLEGLITREIRVADRPSTELMGAGDLLRPWDLDPEELVHNDVVWRVLERAELALLDDGFADRTRPWPEIGDELLRRLGERADGVAMQRAIASHPRVDMRVAMLLWHLAGRFGKVGADGGVHLALPLTHRLIGELIGAERSPVSHAIGRLTRAGLLERDGDGWLLIGTPADHEEAALRPLPPHQQ